MEIRKQTRTPGRPKTAKNEKPTKEIILSSAISLFLKDGFQRVSVEDIAKEAGMTKASVYYYFETKAELFKEAMVALMEHVSVLIIQLLGSDKTLYERLYDVTISHLKSTSTLDLEGFLRESSASLTSEQIQAIKNAEENIFGCIEAAFLQAMKIGEIPQVNAKYAAHSYIALVRVGNYKQQDGTSFFPTIEETAKNIITVFWKGFFGE